MGNPLFLFFFVFFLATASRDLALVSYAAISVSNYPCASANDSNFKFFGTLHWVRPLPREEGTLRNALSPSINLSFTHTIYNSYLPTSPTITTSSPPPPHHHQPLPSLQKKNPLQPPSLNPLTQLLPFLHSRNTSISCCESVEMGAEWNGGGTLGKGGLGGERWRDGMGKTR